MFDLKLVEMSRILCLALTLTALCTAQQCDPGLFGNLCQFRCHCAENGECSVRDGACNNGCDAQWFGPACQYESAGYSTMPGLESEMSWLTDNDDTTCNSGNTQNVTVALDIPQPLTWIRVMVSNSAALDQFQLSYQIEGADNSYTHNGHVSAKVDNTTLDIYCPTSDSVSHLTLTGNVVAGLCSLRISGGRNVALYQRATQSSTYLNWYAGYAVDGNPGIPNNPHSLENTCSHTEPNAGPAYWLLTFADAVSINRLVVYNRREPSRTVDGCCEERLVNFTVEAYPPLGSAAAYTYTDPGGPAQQVYSLIPSPRIDSAVERIRFDLSQNTMSNILTLCEVIIYGEIVCPAGMFGRQCERACNCADQTEACLVSTGGCPSGCAAGYIGEDCKQRCQAGKYGPQCSETCSEFCAWGMEFCSTVDGTCDQGCSPGYQEPLCTEDCPSGTFGLGCSNQCSANCAGPSHLCHHVNGICLLGCNPGYQGEQCIDKCSPGTYGTQCQEMCSVHCAGESNSCNHVNGTCDLGCDDGYHGTLCLEECPSSKFGQRCEGNCSFRCVNKDCNHETGQCIQCADGFIGFTCEQTCRRGSYGARCEQTCSDHCAGEDAICDYRDGSCYLGCEQGYKPPRCQDALQAKEDSISAGAIAGIVVAVIIVVVAVGIGVVLWRRYKKAKRQREPLEFPKVEEPRDYVKMPNLSEKAPKHGQDNPASSCTDTGLTTHTNHPGDPYAEIRDMEGDGRPAVTEKEEDFYLQPASVPADGLELRFQ
ncbi:multiple epidermal growth factor-like domains 10 [Plakobranchus ocellatus]|uniref:Multiple epidermal growth factor-like domains 10 n=1 Tax=Plakobranchus ocellatus TaxID=259542 RepID=A0AAV4AJY0_9GAST|nr:multiple epidermal growth factor-like domains 10 [Plakobranchus ocellatus]